MWITEKINKVDKPLVRLIRKQRKKQDGLFTNDEDDIMRNFKDIESEFYELYVNKLNEMKWTNSLKDQTIKPHSKIYI